MKRLIYKNIARSDMNDHLRVLLITNSIVMFAAAMLGPIYALFVANIGGSILDAGLAYSVYSIVSGLVMIVSGKYSDKFRKEKYAMLVGYFLLSMAFFSYTLVDSVTKLLLVQVLIGFGIAIYYPAYDALYSKNLDKGHFALEWGIDEAKNFFADALGASIGGFIAYKFGFDILFILMGIFTFISMVYAGLQFKQ